MSLLVLALIASVVLPPILPHPTTTGLAFAAGILPQIAIAAAAIAAGRLALRRLKSGRGGAPHRLRVQLRSLQWTAVIAQAIAVQGFGWLLAVRAAVGDLPGVDELIAIAPPMFAIGICWWASHPMEKLLRPSLAGRPRYLLGEFRNQFAILGVPALVAITVLEAGDRIAAAAFDPDSTLALMTLPTAMLLVLVFAPVVMISVLDTTTLAEGASRRIVDRVLQDNGLSLRRVLVWRTGGTLLNGAVVGALHPWRYLLLTDAVLDMMSVESLRAIVAHEVGHLRRRHLPWLVVISVAILGGTALVAEAVAGGVASAFDPDPDDPLVRAVAAGETALPTSDPLLEVAIPIAVAVPMALVGFGWVSRRFERQADTFAVQYLTLVGTPSEEVENPMQVPVRSNAVLAMCRALGRVAELNGVDPAAPSWRHGSIQSRQRHLVGIVGRPVRGLRIDRQIGAIKIAGVALLLVVVGIEILRSGAISWEADASAPVATRPIDGPR